MYREGCYRPSRRWALAPLLIAVGLVAAFVGIALYAPAVASPPPGASYPWLWCFPFQWCVVIPVVFLGFLALRWFLWGGWWWGRAGWYYGGHYDPALEALRERYARGDITQEQYEEMRNELVRQ